MLLVEESRFTLPTAASPSKTSLTLLVSFAADAATREAMMIGTKSEVELASGKSE